MKSWAFRSIVAAVSALCCGVHPDALPAQPADVTPTPTSGGECSAVDPLPPGAVARLGPPRFRAPACPLSIAFTPDGLGLVAGLDLPAGQEQSADRHVVRIWDTATGRRLRDWGGGRGAATVGFDPQGKLLALFGGGGDNIEVRKFPSGEIVNRWRSGSDTPAGWYGAALSPGGQTIAAVGFESQVSVWEVKTGRRLHSLGDRYTRWRLCYSPDGRTLFTAGENEIEAWDVVGGGRRWRLPQPNRGQTGLRRLASSPDGKWLALGGHRDTQGILWAVAADTGRVRWRIDCHESWVNAVAFSPDGRALASYGEEPEVRLWEAETGKLLQRLHGVSGLATCMSFSPDGKTLALGTTDRRVQLWDLATGRERFPASGHRAEVDAVAFSRDGTRLASGANDPDNTVLMWDVTARRRLWSAAHDCPCRLAFSASGKTVVVAGTAGDTVVLDAATGKPLAGGSGPGKPVQALDLSQDGSRLVAATQDGEIIAWNPDQEAPGKVLRPTGQGGRYTSLVFSSDGKVVASAQADGEIRLISLDAREESRRLKTPGGALVRVALLSRTESVAASDREGAIWIWDALGNSPPRKLAGHSGAVNDFALAPDGRTLASAGADGTIRLWELASGGQACCFKGHDGPVRCVAFAHDGRRLASGGDDCTVLVWSTAGPGPLLVPPGQGWGVEQLKQFWDALRDGDVPAAHRAVWLMAASPRTTVPFLRERLRPEPVVAKQQFAELLAGLEDDRFAAREAASRELLRLGGQAVPVINAALRGTPPAETRRRLEMILKGIATSPPPPDLLRQLRAVAVLEYIGTTDARALLRELARGATESKLTMDARAALGRPHQGE